MEILKRNQFKNAKTNISVINEKKDLNRHFIKKIYIYLLIPTDIGLNEFITENNTERKNP